MRQGIKIKLSRSNYVQKVLKRFSMLDKTQHTGQPISQFEYSKVIGSLMYAMTCTRPDIAFAVGKLSRLKSNQGPHHSMAIRRVLRYLLRTKNYGIAYSGEPPILEGYFDASWITNEEGNSSTSGWMFVYGEGDISWSYKKQTCIVDSTISTKFIALVKLSC